MPVAQGINKAVAYKKQTALGTAASGSGGQKYRRVTAVWTKNLSTFENDEIVSHQQSTGVAIGGSTVSGRVEGRLSPGAYTAWLGSLLRRDPTAVSAIASLSLTIATSGALWTVTRASGDFLAGGIKAGHVVRLSVGSLNAANINKNLLVVSLTATALTVKPLNGVALVAEGPIASCTVTVVGKETYVPTASHTADYYTFEDWYADLSRSETFSDAMIASAAVNVPASGNASVSFDIGALKRTLGGSQVLTTPSAEAGNDVVTGAMGLLVVNGSVVANVTGVQFSIDGQTAPGELVVGSVLADDMQRGRVQVSGSFTAKFDGVALQTVFDAGSVINLIVAVAEDLTATADFVVFTLPTIKLTGDAPDDGEKQVIRSYPFTAQYNSAGGSGTSSHQTIIAMQDSAAP